MLTPHTVFPDCKREGEGVLAYSRLSRSIRFVESGSRDCGVGLTSHDLLGLILSVLLRLVESVERKGSDGKEGERREREIA